VVADYSNIEGRVLAAVAGENWKLDAFRAYDAGTGPDLYKLAYAKAFGIDPSAVTKPQRQQGKTSELAGGYQGGVGAYVTMALLLGMDLDEITRIGLDTIPPHILEEMFDRYEWALGKKITHGLDQPTFAVISSLVKMWRDAHPATVQLWADLNNAAVTAIDSPGRTVRSGVFSFECQRGWLYFTMPSSSVLCYPGVSLQEDGGRVQVSYLGENQKTRQWQRLRTYGGKLTENAVQAVARDILADAMLALEAEGFPSTMSVHDEDISEVPLEWTDAYERKAEIMSRVPAWLPNVPLSVAGYADVRYRKD
jgi:DNA polymerase